MLLLLKEANSIYLVPSFGVSSIKPNRESCGDCQFFKKPGCAGDFISISTTDIIEDLSDFDGRHQNWDNDIQRFSCDEKLKCANASSASTDAVSTSPVHQVREIEVRGSTELAENTPIPAADDFCVAMWKDAEYKGDMIRPCYLQNDCRSLFPLNFGVSSVKISTPYTYCNFYADSECKSEKYFVVASGTELNDLSKYFGSDLTWNDRILSHRCFKLSQSQVASSKREISDVSALAPIAAEVQALSDHIGVSIYQDTHFNGYSIGLAVKVEVCGSITKWNGHGENFELSSARINTPTTTSDGKNYAAYCKFFKGKNCEVDTWVSYRPSKERGDASIVPLSRRGRF